MLRWAVFIDSLSIPNANNASTSAVTRPSSTFSRAAMSQPRSANPTASSAVSGVTGTSPAPCMVIAGDSWACAGAMSQKLNISVTRTPLQLVRLGDRILLPWVVPVVIAMVRVSVVGERR